MRPSSARPRMLRALPCALALLLAAPLAHAGALERVLAGRWRQQAREAESGEPAGRAPLPAGVRVLRDLPYGEDARQRMDIYLPDRPAAAPVIFMVHGGGWRHGDKGMGSVVDGKVARWVPRGFLFVSVNYRMLPDAGPAEQERDVAAALAAAQTRAAALGGDPRKFIVMGHSAGAHLVALLAASPDGATTQGVKPWLGTILLDSAALDVASLMKARHLRLYDEAFGGDPGLGRDLAPACADRPDLSGPRGVLHPPRRFLCAGGTLRRAREGAGLARERARRGTLPSRPQPAAGQRRRLYGRGRVVHEDARPGGRPAAGGTRCRARLTRAAGPDSAGRPCAPPSAEL